MANNVGTLVIAPIRPQAEEDEFASAYANEIKGGLHTVEDLTSRNAIPSERREVGMLCSVGISGSPITYQLQGGIDNSDWFPLELESGDLTSLISSVSGDLQSQIDNIDVSGDIESYVNPISGDLQSQIDTNVTNIDTKLDTSSFAAISGNFLQEDDDSAFATNSNLSAISGNLQGQITSNDGDISTLQSQILNNVVDEGTGVRLGEVSNNIASGENAISTGKYATSTGDYSFSANISSSADAEFSFASGYQCEAGIVIFL